MSGIKRTIAWAIAFGIVLGFNIGWFLRGFA